MGIRICHFRSREAIGLALRKEHDHDLYATNVVPVVDDHVMEEYWLKVRAQPIPAKYLRPMQSDGDELL